MSMSLITDMLTYLDSDVHTLTYFIKKGQLLQGYFTNQWHYKLDFHAKESR